MKDRGKSGPRWLKAELHAHCNLDPVDYRMVAHTPEQLIKRAAELQYDVLAITCHNLDIWSRELSDYAGSLGVILIPGMEVDAEGNRHTLAYNFRTGSENVNTFDKIRRRSRQDTLVIAPHAYFPSTTCLRGMLERNIDVIDAIEMSGFYTTGLDFNVHAKVVARRHRKPLVGNGDVHFLWQLGRTFTWIYSETSVEGILNAVKRGAVRIESKSLSADEVARWWAMAIWRYLFPVNPAPTQKIGGAVPDSP